MEETSKPLTTPVLLAKIDFRLDAIEKTTSNLDSAINGNGKPGLVEDHRALQRLVESHLEQAKQDTDARSLLAKETKEAKELLATESKTALDKLAETAEKKLAELALATAKKKEKISARTWAVIMAVIVAVLGMLAGQFAIYMQLLRTS